MTIQEVVERAMADEKFARKLKDQALAATKGGVGSRSWIVLMKNFASNPQELANLGKGLPPSDGAQARFHWTTTLTTLTITTGACTCTTTTTTTTTIVEA